MLHRADQCGCEQDIGMSRAHQPHYCEHQNLLLYAHQLGRGKPNRNRKPMKQGRGFAASPAQRKKVRGLPCIVCGQCSGFDIGDGGGVFVVDPAHVWPRGMGGCDSEDCVVALCRAHHRAFDEGKLDILPALITRECWPEIAHVIEAHHVSPTQLLERLTGTKWAPKEAAHV